MNQDLTKTLVLHINLTCEKCGETMGNEAFNEVATSILGKTANEMGEMKEEEKEALMERVKQKRLRFHLKKGNGSMVVEEGFETGKRIKDHITHNSLKS